MKIGEIIRINRKKRGLTQLALAMRLGVSPQAVGKWERGESEPDFPLLCPLAKELNVTLETLFGLEQREGYRPAAFEPKQLRQNLRARRTAAGLTQAELAEKLGLRPQTVSKWETGVCAPDIAYCKELCALYAITPTELFTELPSAPPPSPAADARPAFAAARAPRKTALHFFTEKPLRLVALLLTLALLFTAILVPLLSGSRNGAPVLDNNTQTESGNDGQEAPDKHPGPPEQDDPTPPPKDETPPDDEEQDPPPEQDDPAAPVRYLTLTFYDGLTNTCPEDNGVFGQGEVPEGTVLVLEEQPDAEPSRTIVGYFEGERCYSFDGLGYTRFDDYRSYGCFDKKGSPVAFPLTVTEDTAFYMKADPLWLDYYSYDSYAEQCVGQEICTILKGACETLATLLNVYETLEHYERISPDAPRSLLLGWAGLPAETIEISVGSNARTASIPWIKGDMPVLRERLTQLAKTDPQAARSIRELVNEHFQLPMAYFFYAVSNESIPLEQGAAALLLFAEFAATMPPVHATAYAAFSEKHAGVHALSLPAVSLDERFLV